MRAELIGHFEACMTDIYLHIDARMADYIRTHPYATTANQRNTQKTSNRQAIDTPTTRKRKACNMRAQLM